MPMFPKEVVQYCYTYFIDQLVGYYLSSSSTVILEMVFTLEMTSIVNNNILQKIKQHD